MRICNQTKPYVLRKDEGECLQSFGAQITVKATSEQTGGVFNLFEVSYPPDFNTPLHIHYAEDVTIFILEGSLAFFWGNEKKEAIAGAYFYQPRGTPHGFRAEGKKPTRVLYMTFPAGLDKFVIAPELRASCSEVMTTAARYKIEILGPLPE